MPKPNFITEIDIGTHSIKGISVLKKRDLEEFEVFAKKELHSYGIRRGIVNDSLKVAETIDKVLASLSEKIGQEITEAFININGSHIFVEKSRGKVAISRADGRISKEDALRVLENAKAFNLPPNKEILEIPTKEYFVDNDAIGDPVGMEGRALELEILTVCIKSVFKKNLEDAVYQANCNTISITPCAIAAANAVLSPEQRELGAVVIDIGSATTNLAVYEEDKLIHIAVFPVGSGHITNDIAIVLKTSIETAEKFKRDFGLEVPKSKKRKTAKKDLPEQKIEDIAYSQKELTQIITCRTGDIFNFIKQELKKVGKDKKLPAGAVLVGGGSKLKGITEFAKKELKLPITIGVPRKFYGVMEDDELDLSKDPSYSTICGLVANDESNTLSVGHSRTGNAFSWIKKIFKLFKP